MATKFQYTDQEVLEIVAKYKQGAELEQLAEEYSKSVASIRMKLVKQGVYNAKTASSKTSKQQDLEEFTELYNRLGPALI